MNQTHSHTQIQQSGATSRLESLLDPASMASVLWRGRRILMAFVGGFLALAVLYLVIAEKEYEATARVLVLSGGGMPLASEGGQSAGLASGAEDEIPTHALLASSPVVVNRAIQSIGIANLPTLGVGENLELTTQSVLEHLTVSRPDRQAKILELTCRANSPQEAARVVRAVAESYQRLLDEVYATHNGHIVNIMTKAHDDLNEELKDLEKKYLEFRRNSPAIVGDSGGRSIALARVDEWNRSAMEAMVKAVQLKTQLELGRELSGKGVGLWSITYALEQVSNHANGLAAMNQGLGPSAPSDYLRLLASEQQKLADSLGPESTKVREIQEQIASVQAYARETRGQLEEEGVNDLLYSIERTLDSIETMRNSIQTKFDADMTIAKQVEIERLTDQNLKNELDRQQKLFDTVVEQLKRSKLVGDFTGTRSHIIEAPHAKASPIRPRKSLTLVMAVAAGLVLGVIGTLSAEVLDPTIQNVDEMRHALPLPILGQVPFVDQSELAGTMNRAALLEPRSAGAEPYRFIQSQIDLAIHGRDCKTLMVTGPRGQEGTSSIVSHLATSYAQSGRRVLIVDANLRNPTQHKILSVNGQPEPIQSNGGRPTSAGLAPHPVAENLDIASCGEAVRDCTTPFAYRDFKALLAPFLTSYDLILIDAPALKPPQEAVSVGNGVDGILLVARVKHSSRAEISRSIGTLEALQAPILGAIINGAVSGQSSRGWRQPKSRAARDASPKRTSNGLEWGAFNLEIPSDPRLNKWGMSAGGDRTSANGSSGRFKSWREG